MDGRLGGWTVGRTDERTNGRTDGRTDGRIDRYGWMDGWTDGRTDGWISPSNPRSFIQSAVTLFALLQKTFL